MSQTTAYPSVPQPIGVAGGEPQMVPYRVTPPWGEQPIYTEYDQPAYPRVEGLDHDWEDRALHAWQNRAHGNGAFALDWENDPQYGYPPPGAPNVQPRDGGHTSHTVFDFSADWPWGIDPAFRAAPFPHMENHFSRYNQNGQWRREGNHPVLKPLFGTIRTDRWLHTQQARDLIVARTRAPGPHQVITNDVPTVTHTLNIQPLDQGAYSPAPIGLEGILPDGLFT